MSQVQAATVFATFTPKAGHTDDVRTLLETMVADTRAEPGNECYDLYSADADGTHLFHLFERYADDAALQAHRESAHYKAYRAAIPDLLAEPIGVAILADVDVVAL